MFKIFYTFEILVCYSNTIKVYFVFIYIFLLEKLVFKRQILGTTAAAIAGIKYITLRCIIDDYCSHYALFIKAQKNDIVFRFQCNSIAIEMFF